MATALSVSVYGQNPGIVWSKSFADRNFGPIMETSDSNYIVIAMIDSVWDHTAMKFDKDGDTIWSSNFNHSWSYDEVNSLVEADNGNYIIVGSRKNFDYGARVGYMMEINKNGKILWDKFLDDSSRRVSFVSKIIKTDNGYIVMGTIYEDLINGGSNFLYVKTDLMGNMVSQKSYDVDPADAYTNDTILKYSIPEYDVDWVSDAVKDENNNLLIIGISFHGIGMLKLSPDGELIWKKSIDLGGWVSVGKCIRTDKNTYLISYSDTTPYKRLLEIADNGDSLRIYEYSVVDDFTQDIIKVSDGYIIGGTQIIKIDKNFNYMWKMETEVATSIILSRDSGFVYVSENTITKTYPESKCNLKASFNSSADTVMVDGTGTRNQKVHFNSTSYYDLSLGINYQWSLDGAVFGADSNFYFEFRDPGIYPVKLLIDNLEGCSDTFVKNIVVKEISIVNRSISICQSDSIFLGYRWRKTSGTYYDFLPDTNVITKLTVYPIDTIDEYYTLIAREIFEHGDISGNYLSHHQSAHGCDSVVNFHVIKPCFPIFMTWKGAIYYSNGMQIDNDDDWSKHHNKAGIDLDTLVSDSGCDSIILTVVHSYSWDTITIGDSIFLQGEWRKEGGTYFDTLFPNFSIVDAYVNSWFHFWLDNFDMSQFYASCATELYVKPKSVVVEGTVYYAGNLAKPMNKVIVSVNGQSAETDASGKYKFDSLEADEYSDSLIIKKDCGGINASDAYLISRYFVGLAEFTPLQKAAANVNGGGVNASDSYEILRLFVGKIDNFKAGTWVWDPDTFKLNEPKNYQINIAALCYGDVNGSFSPSNNKSNSELSARYESSINGEKIVQVPVKVNEDLKVGAISLVFDIPEDLTIIDVDIASKFSQSVFNVINHQVRFSYFNSKLENLKAGEELLTINAKINNSNFNEIKILLNSESAFSDEDGNKIAGELIDIPLITRSSGIGQNEKAKINIYPNPVSDKITVDFSSLGQARCQVVDIIGKTLIDRKIGSGEKIDVSSLVAGSYLIIITGSDVHYQAKILKK